MISTGRGVLVIEGMGGGGVTSRLRSSLSAGLSMVEVREKCLWGRLMVVVVSVVWVGMI